jgi:SAM-dependent methyltransferase
MVDYLQMASQNSKNVDVSPLFEKAGLAVRATIKETPRMYPYKEKIEENWAYYTAVGMQKFRELLTKEGKSVKDAAIVGIGSGVEGIAAGHVFRDSLKHLVVTDIDTEVLSGARENIRQGTEGIRYNLSTFFGSFCEPIEEAEIKVDYIHGNIPNLPSTGKEDLRFGAEKGTFVPPDRFENYYPPQEYVRWALAAQYAYMQSAAHVLKKGGSFTTELGGRVPLHLVRDMFTQEGLCDPSEVIVGFKQQTEALIDFEGYHRLERAHGVEFDFYRYDDGRNLLEKRGIANPTCEVSGDEMKKMLSNFRVSAGEAIDLHHQGVPVGHTVHIFRGIYDASFTH